MSDTLFHNISLFGPTLEVPDSYNVRFFHGDAREGVIQLADLRTIRLELRWRTQRKAGAAVLDLAKRLEKKHGITAQRVGDAYVFDAEKLRAVLTAADGRVLELHWPLACEHRNRTQAAFLASLPGLAEPHWRWQVYGIDARVPRRYALAEWQMLPGRTTLHFADTHWLSRLRNTNRVSVGTFSMAERLLARKNLTDFAIDMLKPPKAASKPAAWQPAGEAAVTTSFRALHRVMFASHHTLTVTHDKAANRIYFEHRIEQRKR